MTTTGIGGFTLLLVILVHFSILNFSNAFGIVELRILSYNDRRLPESNQGNKLCCNKTDKDSQHHSCSQKNCQLFITICLKQYQSKIYDNSSDIFNYNCTYGRKTGLYEDIRNLNLEFPFLLAWTGNLTALIEVWSTSEDPKLLANATTTNKDTFQLNPRRSTLVFRYFASKRMNVDSIGWSDETWNDQVTSQHHKEMKVQFKVKCQPNYYGNSCSVYCKPHDDKFGHFVCNVDGRRVCMDGWTGLTCNKPKCLPGCHPEHGICTRPNECRCRVGYAGQFCDHCIRYPGCKHGACKQPYECMCDEGWGGFFCNHDLNYCAHHRPCLNGATCVNTGNGLYSCECRSGYAGVNCEIKIETCVMRPCLNGGTCRETGVNYTCSCPSGFSGKHCQTQAKTCHDAPCENGATCVAVDVTDAVRRGNVAEYLCQCPPGWQGNNCDVEKDMCYDSPCVNGGSCVSRFGTFTCVCPMGFEGDRCEMNRNDCGAHSCLNGGTCLDGVDNFRCLCKPGYSGTLCQHNVDDCRVRPCANGGTCFDMINDYRCECRPGFKGKDCSIDVNECESNPCRFGGTCIDLVNDYKCQCPTCYAGKDCKNIDELCLTRSPKIDWIASTNQRASKSNVDISHLTNGARMRGPNIYSNPYVVGNHWPIDDLAQRRRMEHKDDSDENDRHSAVSASTLTLSFTLIVALIALCLFIGVILLIRKLRRLSSPSCDVDGGGGGVIITSSSHDQDEACRRENLHNLRLQNRRIKNLDQSRPSYCVTSSSTSVAVIKKNNNHTNNINNNNNNNNDNNNKLSLMVENDVKTIKDVWSFHGNDQNDAVAAASRPIKNVNLLNAVVNHNQMNNNYKNNSKIYTALSVDKSNDVNIDGRPASIHSTDNNVVVVVPTASTPINVVGRCNKQSSTLSADIQNFSSSENPTSVAVTVAAVGRTSSPPNFYVRPNNNHRYSVSSSKSSETHPES